LGERGWRPGRRSGRQAHPTDDRTSGGGAGASSPSCSTSTRSTDYSAASAALAPAMPVVIQKKKMLIGLFGLAVNSEFHYPNYFAMIPSGPVPKIAFTQGFFDVAMAQSPQPQTVAIVAADAEFSANASDGARDNAKAAKLNVVYDKKYPPSTTDFAPIVRAIAATNPDLVVICSYPPDSVGMVKAVNEVGLKPKMIGAGMVGLQATAIKTQLGPLLNGFVNYDFWLPVPKMNFPGVAEFMQKYQAKAATEGVDPLGYYIGPWGYAQLQVIEQAINATKSLNDDKLADYLRANTFKTIVGDVAFGKDGEWAQSRVLQVQFQNVKGNDVAQFKDISTQVVVAPPAYQSGKVIYPAKAEMALQGRRQTMEDGRKSQTVFLSRLLSSHPLLSEGRCMRRLALYNPR
jgi:branched-chain amino acid transport system substrate-binding protein